MRRVHRGEHTLNVNHPRSQDALAAGMGRALDRAIEKRGGSLGHTTINNHFDFSGSVLQDERAMNKLVDKIEDVQRGRRNHRCPQ